VSASSSYGSGPGRPVSLLRASSRSVITPVSATTRQQKLRPASAPVRGPRRAGRRGEARENGRADRAPRGARAPVFATSRFRTGDRAGSVAGDLLRAV
jgi:hypothetical protein